MKYILGLFVLFLVGCTPDYKKIRSQYVHYCKQHKGLGLIEKKPEGVLIRCNDGEIFYEEDAN